MILKFQCSSHENVVDHHDSHVSLSPQLLILRLGRNVVVRLDNDHLRLVVHRQFVAVAVRGKPLSRPKLSTWGGVMPPPRGGAMFNVLTRFS